MSSATPQVPTEWVGANSRGITYLVVSTVLVCLSGVTVGLRLLARWRQYHRFFPDDYFSIIAQFFAFILMAWAFNFTLTCAMGWHVTEVPPAQVERFLKFFYVAELTYGFINPFYKLAVIFLYRRIFGHIRNFSIATWVMTGITIGFGVSGLTTAIFQCTPIDKNWMPTKPGFCINSKSYILGNGIANLVIDAMILFLPVPVILNLQLVTSKKLALIGMFLLGSAVCVVSIIRVTTLMGIDFSDPTYNLVTIGVWSEVEPALGIISACLPTLRQWFWQKISASYSSRKYGSNAISGVKSPLDSVARTNTAVALTGWKNADTYSEIKGSTSGSTTPPFDMPEHNPPTVTRGGDIEYLGNLSHEEDDKSIFVTTEFSVRHDTRGGL